MLNLGILTCTLPLLNQAESAPVLQMWLLTQPSNAEAEACHLFSELLTRIRRINRHNSRETHTPSLTCGAPGSQEAQSQITHTATKKRARKRDDHRAKFGDSFKDRTEGAPPL